MFSPIREYYPMIIHPPLPRTPTSTSVSFYQLPTPITTSIPPPPSPLMPTITTPRNGSGRRKRTSSLRDPLPNATPPRVSGSPSPQRDVEVDGGVDGFGSGSGRKGRRRGKRGERWVAALVLGFGFFGFLVWWSVLIPILGSYEFQWGRRTGEGAHSRAGEWLKKRVVLRTKSYCIISHHGAGEEGVKRPRCAFLQVLNPHPSTLSHPHPGHTHS